MSAQETHTLPVSEGERVDLSVTGMTCAACARRIERKLSKVPGVRRAGVNFATARATVEYDPQATGVREFVETIKDVGYGTADADEDADDTRAAEYRETRRKFLVAAVLSLPVLFVAMSHGRLSFLEESWTNWLQLALTTPVVFYSGAQFYRGAWAALRHRAADMSTLIATGTGAAYIYSTAATLAPGFFAY
ncbi:MAG TPA: cation transporter, partial [Pyrinomonadaceae bacterium]